MCEIYIRLRFKRKEMAKWWKQTDDDDEYMRFSMKFPDVRVVPDSDCKNSDEEKKKLIKMECSLTFVQASHDDKYIRVSFECSKALNNRKNIYAFNGKLAQPTRPARIKTRFRWKFTDKNFIHSIQFGFDLTNQMYNPQLMLLANLYNGFS